MTAQDLKNSILQLAVQGKLVSQDPSDEPASELLMRIAAAKAKLIKDGKIKKEKTLPVIADEEKPFDIPENWCWIRLNDICSIVTGKKDANFASENGKYNFFTCAKDPLLCDSFSFCGESLLLAGNGDISNISYFAGEFEAYQRTYVLQPYIEYAYLRYLFYHLQYNWVDYNGDKTFGSAIPYIRLGNVQNYLVALPPLAEQKRIVAKIEELMPLVEEYGKTEERIKALNAEFPDKLRKSILQQAVQGKLTERNPLDEPASELIKRIRAERAVLQKNKVAKKSQATESIAVDEIPFDIPETWEWVNLGWICQKVGAGSTPKGGSTVYVAEGVKFLREQNVHDDGLRLDGVVYIDEATHTAKAGSHVQAQDILMNITGASIGRNALVPDDFDTANVNQHVLIIRLVDKELRHYLHYCFSSPTVLNQMFTKQAGDKPGLSATKVENFLVPIPPLEEQKRIVARVEELLAVCDGLK